MSEFTLKQIGLIVEKASVHISPDRHNSFFARDLLTYLDGKPVTPRRLGAFSFAVPVLGTDMYGINGSPKHFAYKNREYASIYFSFGGSPNTKCSNDPKSPKLSSFIRCPNAAQEKKFSVKLIERYGECTPYYNLPLPVGLDFESPEVDAIHQHYVSACVGVRMTHDTTGLINEKRLEEILGYVLENIADIPCLSYRINLLQEVHEASLFGTCKIEFLIKNAMCLGDRQLVNYLLKYGDYFRLMYISDQMFMQATGFYSLDLPIDSAIKESVLDQIISDEKGYFKIVRERNYDWIKESALSIGCNEDNIFFKGNRSSLLKMSPIDLKISKVNSECHISLFDNEPIEMQNCGDRFHPSDKTKIVFDTVVFPGWGSEDLENHFDDEIFRELNVISAF